MTTNTTEGNSTNSTLEGLAQFNPFMTATNFINLFLALPTNGYVLWLIVSGVGGTIESEFFALNLTVSAMFFCVFNFLYLINIFINSMVLASAAFFSGAILYVAFPLFQTCICLERYLAVVHPVVFLRYRALRYRLACCSVVWLLVTSECFISALVQLSFTFFMGVQLLVLSLVQLFCCLCVLRVLRQPGPGEEGGRGREGRVSSNIKRRAFKIILLILITTMITYCPFIITALLWGLSVVNIGQFSLAFIISVCIAIMFGLIQPLLFLHRTGKLPCLNMAP